MEIQCKFFGCNQRFQRKFENEHNPICDYRTVDCQHCGEEKYFLDIEVTIISIIYLNFSQSHIILCVFIILLQEN